MPVQGYSDTHVDLKKLTMQRVGHVIWHKILKGREAWGLFTAFSMLRTSRAPVCRLLLFTPSHVFTNKDILKLRLHM